LLPNLASLKRVLRIGSRKENQMAKRRGSNEGSIYQDSEGRWRASVNLGFKAGKRSRKLLSGRTRAEVAEKLNAVLSSVHQGLPVNTERVSVGQFLETWLEQAARPKVRPKTFRVYEQLVRLHLKPGFDRIPLGKLSARHVDQFLGAKATAGLSARTLQFLHAVLRSALNQALKWDMVSRNVATLVASPSVTRRDVSPYNGQEARTLLSVLSGDRLEAVYTVALAVGLRQGEILGVRWADVDFEAGELHVRTQLQRIDGKLQLVEPKRDSRRTVPLPAVLITTLQAHRERQEVEKALAGSRWVDTGLVFTTRVGAGIDQRTLLKHYDGVIRLSGLRRIRFHDLRHTCASLLLAQGVQMKVIQEILGHADIRVTMNLYGHLFPESKRAAAAKMNDMLSPALDDVAALAKPN
jgi:integrase